jgi:hypothetical protein
MLGVRVAVCDGAASKMCIMAFADGPEPEARMGHTCTLVGHKLFIIGGKGSDGRLVESIHILDTGKRLASCCLAIV